MGLGGVNPTGHRNLVLIPVHHAQKLNALLPLRMSLQKTTNSNSLLPNTASNDIQQHVNSANSGDVDDCHSDSDSCAPEVMVPDARAFSSMQY